MVSAVLTNIKLVLVFFCFVVLLFNDTWSIFCSVVCGQHGYIHFCCNGKGKGKKKHCIGKGKGKDTGKGKRKGKGKDKGEGKYMSR